MRSTYARAALAAMIAILFACADRPERETTISLADSTTATDAAPYWNDEPALTMEDLERGRHDSTWLRAAVSDSTPLELAPWDSRARLDSLDVEALPDPEPAGSAPFEVTTPFPETYDDLDDVAAAGDSALPAVRLPIGGSAQGPSVLYVQVLLDRSPFSPGIVDGKWGKNSSKAVWWLQRAEGLEPTGEVDSLTFARLVALAGAPEPYVRTVRLEASDVAGPFVEIPADVHAQAELDCMCYRSALEQVAERYHSAPELLERLNPGRALDSLLAGDSLMVPDVDALADGHPAADGGPMVSRLVVSIDGFYVHALDEAGRLLYHFPATLGSKYQPSPDGAYEIVSVTFDPWFHWQPALFDEVPDTEPDARIPPGPNSPVGVVWMALSKDNYGIHGTSEPATIGYATSHGCVRLTNWDARFLAERVEAGVPVVFRDLQAEEAVATAR
jgi:hypothetical protein